MEKVFIFIGIMLCLIGNAHAGFIPYTSFSDFKSTHFTNYAWGFEGLASDGSLLTNVSGPGSISMVQGRAAIDNIFLTDTFVYFNPQSANGDFVFDSSSVNVFGLSLAWHDGFNPNGVIATFYDVLNKEIGSVEINSENAERSILDTTGLYYEAFLGVESADPIGRIKMTQQFPGAVFYDNLLWEEAAFISIPTSPTPPSSPFAPKAPNSPTAPKTPKSPQSPQLLFSVDDFSSRSAAFEMTTLEQEPVAAPEPATMALFATGIAGALIRRKKR